MKHAFAFGCICLVYILRAQGLDLGTTTYSPTFVANLSNPYNETSGLAFANDTLFSINDSGNQPFLHAMSSTGQHLQSWTIQNAVNVDWEAIALSPTALFIGDIGNNSGDRIALDIYRITRSDLAQATTSVTAQKQTLQFADQPLSGLVMNAHNYDCEAMVFWQDSLHFFSKNWENLWTRHYVVPIIWQDTLMVSPIDSFFVNGLITDAGVDQSSNSLYLLGYKNELSGLYSSFMYRYAAIGQAFSFADYQRMELGSTLNLAQTEGLCLSGNAKGFISGEQIVSIITIPPKLHSFDFSTLAETPVHDKSNIYFHANILYIPQSLLPAFSLIDMSGRIAFEWQYDKNDQDLTNLKPGTYILFGPNYRRKWIKSS
jgi:hypothetical protein